MFGKMVVKGFVPIVMFLTMLLCGQTVMAESENIEISGIRINPSTLNGYEILIDAPEMPEMEKTVVSENAIILNIKNAQINKGAAVVYNNAKGIEHVIIKRVSKSDIEVNIAGEHIAQSSILLNAPNSTEPELVEDRIFVNRPLNEYEPIHQDDYYEPQTNIFMSFLIRLKNSQLLRDLLHSSNTGWLVCIALILGFFMFSKKQPAQIMSQDEHTGNVKEESKFEPARGMIGESLISDNNSRLKRHSAEHETRRIPSQTLNYGLKAYNNQAMGQRGLRNIPEPKKPVVPNVRGERKTVSRAAMAQEVKKDEIQIDNVKFLESMAKIYQKSGRTDLANGLASNIKKARTRN